MVGASESRRSSTTARSNCVSDGELQAYVDGLLAPDDRSRVESFLSSCPEERERLDAYRRQNVQLHRLFDWAAHRPLPGGYELLAHKLAGRIRRQRYMSNMQRAAAAVVVMAVVGATGWLPVAHPEPGPVAGLQRKGSGKSCWSAMTMPTSDRTGALTRSRKEVRK